MLTIGVCVPAAARAEDVPPPTAEWRAVAVEMAAPWPGLQRPTGNLPDYLDDVTQLEEGTRYGDALMGLGLMQTGLREGDERLLRTGIAAVNYATSGERHWPRPSVFETMAVASAYNLGRERLGADADWQAARPQWEQWLRRVRIVRLQYVNRYGNHWLVDAISVLELERTGIRSNHEGTVLGTGRRTAHRAAVRLINDRVPRIARGRGPYLLSDPPDNPPAYQALSLGLYARAIDLLGERAAPAARKVLRRVARASQLVAAPDGDVAYFGRSQAEIWALPATAYGAEVAATEPGTSGAQGALDRALAIRAVERMRDAYPIGSRGQWITPALADDLAAAAPGVDGYAGAPSMGGLALVLLNWAIDREPVARPAADLPADGEFATTLSQEDGRFAVVRHGATWFAVKQTRSRDRHHYDDLRYDFGLIVAKRRTDDGRWRELVPQRPRTTGGAQTTSGPILYMPGRAPGYPYGRAIAAASDGTVTVSGGFRTLAGHVLRKATFQWRPISCGVTLSWAARAGESFANSELFRGQNPPRLDATSATAAGQQVTTSPPPAWGPPQPAGASGIDARLVRQPLVLTAHEPRKLSITWCDEPKG